MENHVFLEINNFLFVDVALRAASTLKNLTFLYLVNVLEVSKNIVIWLDLSIGSTLELLVLKKYAESLVNVANGRLELEL